MSFESLGLSQTLLKSVEQIGYSEPTPVQEKTIPHILEGKDVMAGAQTGTGKTGAFALPVLQKLMDYDAHDPRHKNRLRALILTPTRELAAQVEESVRTYGRYTTLKSTKVFGGVSIGPQIKALKSGIDILVATPGRLLDLHSQGAVDFSALQILVLDEADRMLDMGFIKDISRIIKLLPKKRQNLFFSATFNDEIRKLAASFLVNPVEIDSSPRNSTHSLVTHRVYFVDRMRKPELLTYLISKLHIEQALVFTRTKHGANQLVEYLMERDFKAAAIHGNKSQAHRTKALADFKNKRIKLLIATDIAARGIDIEQLPYVINFELPMVPEDYVHRIGRTGRAGSTGEALSLVCVDEHQLLKGIERFLKHPVDSELVDGFHPDPNIKAEPIENGKRGRRTGHRPGDIHRPGNVVTTYSRGATHPAAHAKSGSSSIAPRFNHETRGTKAQRQSPFEKRRKPTN